MRFVYADESGISVNESILVVAGVILHADTQFVRVEQYVREIGLKYVAERDRSGFVFHAKDLFNGSGKVFGNRDRYPLERSHRALKRLLSIPSIFKLPVVFGFTRKETLPKDAKKKALREARALDHAIAFSNCAISAEMFMRNHVPDNEVATLTAEDNTETKKTVKLMHDALRGVHPEYEHWVIQRELTMGLGHDFFPLRRIRDTVNFVGKSGAFLLQVADACAWIIRLYLEEKPGLDEFLRAFAPRGAHAIFDLEQVRANFAGVGEVRFWELA